MPCTISILIMMIFNSVILTLLVTIVHTVPLSSDLNDGPPTYLEALVGSEVLLPCDVAPPIPQDNSILVLFYRGQNKTPIYSMDSRGSNVNYGIHWNADYINHRSYLETEGRITGLLLKDIRLNDTGLYRCRVDFDASPTRNTQIQLRVVEAPLRMNTVSMYEGERDSSEVIGPYPLGARIIVSCQVIGGFPSPDVSWWHEGKLLDDVSEVKSGGVSRNSLSIPKLDRKDLLKTLTCQANNSNLMSPLTKRVTIDLAFEPHAIRISTSDEVGNGSVTTMTSVPLRVTCIAGKNCPLMCHVDGSRPPPLITWKSNGRTLESHFQTISNPVGSKDKKNDDTSSSSFSSTLMLKPDKTYDRALISCRASSPALPEHIIEDRIRLDIQYPPNLEARVRSGVDVTNIEENEEIVIECLVEANPPVNDVQWTRDWVPVLHNESAGTFVTKNDSTGGSTLFLRGVKSEMSGYYSCAAANTLGSGTSNVVRLSVKYSPKCSPSQVTSVGVGKAEKVNITCNVRAHPVATLFRWAFNTSKELIDIPFDSQVSKDVSSSTISYEPTSHFDFGDLLCWASNSVGSMKDPCIIKILPIDKPEEVRGCTIASNSSMPGGVLFVRCLPGWDGGLTQTFTLEVRKAAHVHARVLAALQHSSEPVFVLRNLQPSVEYLLTVTSANARGTSPPVTLTYASPKGDMVAVNKHSKPQSTFMRFIPYIAIFVALIVILTTCGSVIACIARARAADKAEMQRVERKMSCSSGKLPVEHSLPPDRGKLEEDNYEFPSKDSDGDFYCALHGPERAQNDYVVTGSSYFDGIPNSNNLEKQQLLCGRIKECSPKDNQMEWLSTRSIISENELNGGCAKSEGNTVSSMHHSRDVLGLRKNGIGLDPILSTGVLSISSDSSLPSKKVFNPSGNMVITDIDDKCFSSSSHLPLEMVQVPPLCLSHHTNRRPSILAQRNSTSSCNHIDDLEKNYLDKLSLSAMKFQSNILESQNKSNMKNVKCPPSLCTTSAGNSWIKPYSNIYSSLSPIYSTSVLRKLDQTSSAVDPILEHIRNERKVSRESSV